MALDDRDEAQTARDRDRDRERELSRLLPSAVSLSSRRSDQLASALRPAIENALEQSARQNRPALVDALFTVVGEALRKAMRERVRCRLLGINRFVLVTLSMRSLAWRVEALRSGRSFRDIVKERTMARRIKQVFLIHRRTGLLLETASGEEQRALDGDMVSAMLTAIQDFVSDSFGIQRRSGLESIRVGGQTVWIEQGRLAVLAGVVDGPASPEVRELFHDTLETIHRELRAELETFSGSTDAFQRAHLYLEAAVWARLRDTGERILPLTWGLLGLPLCALLLVGGMHVRNAIVWRAYVKEMAANPGVVILESGWRGGRFFIRGLRDPMALDPVAWLAPMGLDKHRIDSHWQPYHALTPEMIVLRAKRALQAPPTVSLALEGQTLRARGAAPREWVAEATRIAPLVPGVTALDTAGLAEADQKQRRLWEGYLNRLMSQPGMVIVDAGHREDRFHVTGLRDPDGATDPRQLLRELGIDERLVESHWESFASSHPDLTKRRAVRILQPPRTVSLDVREGELMAEGEADHRWIADARLLARGIVGVTSFDTGKLVDRDRKRWLAVKQELEGVRIRFSDQGTDLLPGQGGKIRGVVDALVQLQTVSRALRMDARVQIRGYARDARDEDANLLVSSVLCQRFRDILEKQNADSHRLSIVAMGSKPPTGGRTPDASPLPKRFVALHVIDENESTIQGR